MGQITILNGTNTVINTCISAGVNYSWCNKLSPGKYYRHDGAAGVYTLNSRYWFGEDTEYSNSKAEIGLFVAGIIIGVVGLALVPFTLGGSLAEGSVAFMAVAASIVGTELSTAGLAISGISIAVTEFENAPSKWTNIHALQDRKFIAESVVESREVKQPDGTTVLEFVKIPEIKYRELSDKEFMAYLESGAFTEHQSKPITGSYATSASLKSSDLKNRNITIRPAWGGEASWEIENDQKSAGSPVQLWGRPGEKKVEWNLVPANDKETNDTFYLYNPALERYIGGLATLGGQVSIKVSKEPSDGFHLIPTEDARYNREDQTNNKNCFVFIPVNAKQLTVIAENGNIGNSTKLKYGPITTIHPVWAMWKIIPS